MKKICTLVALVVMVFLSSICLAGDGMWLPLLLKQLNEQEMKAMGMKMSAEDIFSLNKSSLKDAIALFAGGCTAGVISPDGLLLTNHHCGDGFIQMHTTLEHNYLQDGFWAKTRKDELPCAGLKVTFVQSMEDVSAEVLAGVTDSMNSKERQSRIDQNINALKASKLPFPGGELLVRQMFEGNQYYLFFTLTFTDVRLVGAPPSAIGNFGADTDNWSWPRHTGDFSMFRIYASQDNMPAAYAADNVPYKPAHYLPVSLDGVQDGDFTLVMGFPGRTNEYLSSFELDQVVTILDPARVSIRDESLKIMGDAMRNDPQIKIQYTEKYARLANGWKKWQGEVLGLKSTKAVAKKQQMEIEFQRRVDSKPNWKSSYGNLLPDMRNLVGKLDGPAEAREYLLEIFQRNTELTALAIGLQGWVGIFQNNGPDAFAAKKEDFHKRFDGFFKDYRPGIDEEIFSVLSEMYVHKMQPAFVPAAMREGLIASGGDYKKYSSWLFANSIFVSEEKMAPFWEMKPEQAVAALQADPVFVLCQQAMDIYRQKITPEYETLRAQLDRLQQQYMKAQIEVFSERKFYPDANGTLRVTYGKVEGFEPRDGMCYKSKTYLDGVLEKYKPGDYEFDVPARMLDLAARRDFGQYAENGRLPVAFIGSNHTSGGNSGSPVVDGSGNLIGLNFDRVWEGTMSDYNYDSSLCRNIMVDIRYVLFVIDKYADATHLIREMKLVHPKMTTKKKRK